MRIRVLSFSNLARLVLFAAEELDKQLLVSKVFRGFMALDRKKFYNDSEWLLITARQLLINERKGKHN